MFFGTLCVGWKWQAKALLSTPLRWERWKRLYKWYIIYHISYIIYAILVPTVKKNAGSIVQCTSISKGLASLRECRVGICEARNCVAYFGIILDTLEYSDILCTILLWCLYIGSWTSAELAIGKVLHTEYATGPWALRALPTLSPSQN